MYPAAAPFALFDDNLHDRGDLLLTDLRDCIVCAAATTRPPPSRPSRRRARVRALGSAGGRGDGVLHTPPLASGALDGLFRRKLLDEGRACETRLTRGDLHDAHFISVANALRGLVRVALAA
jgi:hypothetical protein